MTNILELPRTPKASFYGNQFGANGEQTRVNASTFQTSKACLRKYLYEVLLARRKPETDPHLRFGTLIHAAKALFELNKSRGASHDLALQGAFRFLLRETWDEVRAKPGFTEDPLKNRSTLLRTFVWYADQYRDDTFETVMLPSGAPAIEVQFEFDSGVRSASGEPVTFVGTIDKIGKFNGVTYVGETKTSSSARFLTAQNYTPDGQFSLYTCAALVCFGIESDGVVLDGIEIGTNATAFRRVIVPRPREVLEEWLRDARVHLRRLSEAFGRNEWPQNDAACGLYGGCRFRGVCGANPAERAGLLGLSDDNTATKENQNVSD